MGILLFCFECIAPVVLFFFFFWGGGVVQGEVEQKSNRETCARIVE